MKTLESTGQLKAKDVQALNLPSGTPLTKVKCFDGNTGNLVSIDYVLKSDPRHDDEVYDLMQVADGYFTETWNVKIK